MFAFANWDKVLGQGAEGGVVLVCQFCLVCLVWFGGCLAVGSPVLYIYGGVRCMLYWS